MPANRKPAKAVDATTAKGPFPVAAESSKLGAYRDYWLENVVKPTRRPTTYSLYETIALVYLKPGLGQHQRRRLSVRTVQSFLNDKLTEGQSTRMSAEPGQDQSRCLIFWANARL